MDMTQRCCWLLVLAVALTALDAIGGEAPAEQAETLKKLEKPASLALRGVAWEDAFRELSDSLECRIEVEKPFPDTRPLWVWTQTLPGRGVLDLVCELTDRAWTVQKGSVIVCSRERAWELLGPLRREYDLGAALGLPGDAEVIQAVVRHVLGPPSGAWGARVALEGGKHLVVTASEAEHRLVARLVEGLRALPRNGSAQFGSPPLRQSPGHRLLEQARREREWSRKKLQERTNLEFVEAPLHKVLEHVAKVTKVNIRFVPGAVAGDAPVSFKVADMPLGRALDRIARTANLTTEVTSDLIVFRHREGHEEREPQAPPALAMHDFADVVALGWPMDDVVDFLRRYGSGEGEPDQEDEDAEREVQDGAEKRPKAAQPDPKLLLKGPGDGDFTARLGTRVIVGVASDWREHLAWVVPAMRERKNPPQRPGVTDTYAPGCSERMLDLLVAAATDDTSQQALDRPISLHMNDVTIKQALAAVASALGCTADLDDDEVPRDLRDRQVSLHLDDAPGSTALALLCFALGPGWVPWTEDGRVRLNSASAGRGDSERELYLAWGAATTRDEAIELAAMIEKLFSQCGVRSCRARPGYYLDVLATSDALAFVGHLRSWLANLEPGERRELPDPTGQAHHLRHRALQVRDKFPAHLAAKMKKPVRAAPRGAPLADLLAELGSQAGATLILDPDAELPKAEARLEGDKLTLADALRAAEEQTGTVHVATDHAFLLTTPERSRLLRPATWAIYDVRNVAPDDVAAAQLAARLLEECGKHKEWGSDHLIERHKRRLIICTTPAIHERIPARLKEAPSQAPSR